MELEIYNKIPLNLNSRDITQRYPIIYLFESRVVSGTTEIHVGFKEELQTNILLGIFLHF